MNWIKPVADDFLFLILGLNVPEASKEITAARSLGSTPIHLATSTIAIAFSGVKFLLLMLGLQDWFAVVLALTSSATAFAIPTILFTPTKAVC